MKTNIGTTDRNIRIVLGIAGVAVGVYFSSWWGLVGVPLILTGIFRFCGLYRIFGISTCPAEPPAQTGAV